MDKLTHRLQRYMGIVLLLASNSYSASSRTTQKDPLPISTPQMTAAEDLQIGMSPEEVFGDESLPSFRPAEDLQPGMTVTEVNQVLTKQGLSPAGFDVNCGSMEIIYFSENAKVPHRIVHFGIADSRGNRHLVSDRVLE